MQVDFVVGEVEMRYSGEGVVGVELVYWIAHAASGEVKTEGILFVDFVAQTDVSEELHLLIFIVGIVLI